jgi:hypothetical protein
MRSNVHSKGLALNRRGGELYGEDAILAMPRSARGAGPAFSMDELRGFSQEEADRLRDLVFRRTGRGRG